MSRLLETAKKIISRHYLCDNCLGRMFGGLSYGLSNAERGRIIREIVKMDVHLNMLEKKKIERRLVSSLIYRYGESRLEKIIKDRDIRIRGKYKEQKCEICGNLFDNIYNIVKKNLDEILEYKFDTYIVGVESIPLMENKEEKIKREFRIWFSENIRGELSREIGKILEKLLIERGIESEYGPRSPTATIIFNLQENKVLVDTKPIVISYKLNKLKENVSIFARKCDFCNGKGCMECGYIGKRKDKNLEYFLGTYLLKLTGGKRWRFSIKYLDEERRVFQIKYKIINPKVRKLDKEHIELFSYRLRKLGFEILNNKEM